MHIPWLFLPCIHLRHVTGVQQITNPDIVPVSMVSPENTSGNSQFDASIDSFDNNV
jgi:hypothetical protein